jgi:alpha-galactosidase
LEDKLEGRSEKIAGINHMAWLLEIRDTVGNDLYPEIRKRAAKKNRAAINGGLEKHGDMVRFDYIEKLGYYCTESSEHNAEYNKLASKDELAHERSKEYASHIMESMVTGVPCKIGGNVLNHGLIDNLPKEACVEVPCLVDKNGVNPCYSGPLPLQLAAMNMSNINVHLLTIEAAHTRKKEHIYHAAMMDPHTAAELSLDDIRKMVDELIEAHGKWLPEYR